MNDFYLGLYEKATPTDITWKERLKVAKEAGYSFLELSIDESDRRQERLYWSPEKRREIINISKDINMPIRTMCLSGHRRYPLGSSDKNTEEKSLEIMDRAIDLAVDLGIRIIQLAGYDVYYETSTEQTKQRFIKNLKECVGMASKKSVLLGLETMEVDFMKTVEKAMYYVNQMNSPYLNVYPDTGNITNATSDVIGDIMKGKGHIIAAHLKETIPNVYREVRFGEGHVDFVSAIKAYKSIGVNMFLAEFWYDKNTDWKSELKYSIDFLTEKYNEALKGTHDE